MALSFFVSFMHALRPKKSLNEINSKNYSPDGFNTHYGSMQHNVSLINLFPHILIQWLKQTIPPFRLVKLNDFQFVGTNFAENWIHNKLAEQYNLLERFLQLWLNVL